MRSQLKLMKLRLLHLGNPKSGSCSIGDYWDDVTVLVNLKKCVQKNFCRVPIGIHRIHRLRTRIRYLANLQTHTKLLEVGVV